MTNQPASPTPPDAHSSESPETEAAATAETVVGDPIRLYVLLDRSGSMQSIHTETVAGFNAFLAGQQINGDDARVTLVQFDDHDLADTLVDDQPISRVRALRGRDFQPRGATPLLDATAHLIARAKADAGTSSHPVVIVTITDGLENASREFTRDAVRDLVSDREAAGWTFVFLSAGLDAYAEARSFGYAEGSVQAWSPDGEGANLAFASLSLAVGDLRSKTRRGEQVDRRDVFAGSKPAEADRQRKRGDRR